MLDSHFVDEFQEVRACLRACVCLCVCLRVPACLRVCVCVCPARPCPATDRRIPPPPHLCVRVTGGATAAGAAPPQRRAVLWRRHVPGRQPVPRTLPTLHLSTSHSRQQQTQREGGQSRQNVGRGCCGVSTRTRLLKEKNTRVASHTIHRARLLTTAHACATQVTEFMRRGSLQQVLGSGSSGVHWTLRLQFARDAASVRSAACVYVRACVHVRVCVCVRFLFCFERLLYFIVGVCFVCRAWRFCTGKTHPASIVTLRCSPCAVAG